MDTYTEKLLSSVQHLLDISNKMLVIVMEMNTSVN